MNKLITAAVLLMFIVGLGGCTRDNGLKIKNEFLATDLALVEEYTQSSKEVIFSEYYELSDGTWKCGEYTYKYRLIINGRLNNAEKGITYTILSNIEEISFDQAWKASGLSSNLDDYFKEEDAVIVSTQIVDINK